MSSKLTPPSAVQRAGYILIMMSAAAAFFLAVCLNASSTIKSLAVFLIILTLSAVFLFYGKLRDRFLPPVMALGLVVLMDGFSILYAVSRKFALYEFLKVLAAFCLAMLLIAFTGSRAPGRQAACVLEGCVAIAGLVSIDLLSTRWISTPVLNILDQFTSDYSHLAVVEEGVRMTSLFMNPNVFAGCAGICVLLSLGLAVSAKGRMERVGHLICLYINALSFVLAFSIGACAAIVLGFLTILVLEQPERRPGLTLLMIETFVLTLFAAFPISLTSLTVWSGVQPVPMLCVIGGAAGLVFLDYFSQRMAVRLHISRKAVLGLAAGALIGLALFLTAACLLTGGVTLQPESALRRAAYPKPGDYTLTAEADDEVTVLIESQNREETMMHTSTELYHGRLSQAAFTVPADSMVVYFNFSANTPARLESVAYAGDSGSGKVPLGYRLLPAFAANRIQGLFANQNAIQRIVFFEDGIKLFQRNPLLGMGMGAFENGIKSVQSFYYVTKYAHNHYIQTLAETGIVGLLLFIGVLAVSAMAVWRSRQKPLAPALGAALVFMAAHGAVEVVFSAYPYLPIAFGVFAVINLECGSAVPAPWAEKRGVKAGLLLSTCGLLAVFGILLNCNMVAQGLAYQAEELADLQEAIRLDRFERADYMLSYVMRTSGADATREEREQADAYVQQLSALNSNAIPIYLAEYYLETGRLGPGLEMAEKYVSYVSSDPAAWQQTFDLLARYETDDEIYRTGILRIAALMDAWNQENMGRISVDEAAAGLIARAQS